MYVYDAPFNFLLLLVITI